MSTSDHDSVHPAATTLVPSSRTSSGSSSGSIAASSATHALSATSTSSFPTSLVTASSPSSGPSESVSWGPAITAPSSNPSSAQAMNSPQPQFSEGSKRLLYATTTIGGTLLIAFLVYAMYRLHKGAAFSDVVRFRTRQSILSYGRAPREARRFTSLPIHRESHFSMRSSYHKHSATSSSSYTAKGKPPATPPVSEMKKQCWKTAHPPSTPKQTTGSFLVDATPPVSLKEPAKARVSVSRRSSTKPPSSYQPSLGNSTNKSRITFAIREASPVEALAGTPPDSPTSVTNAQDRWSWTNSQAPTTPRLYAPESRRSSSTPMPRFQTVSSWIDTQPDSIAEENDAKAVLKKQASKSSLASSSPKKLSKSDKTKVNANHGRMASLTSMFRQHSVNKAASPPLPKAGEKARADKGNTSARRKS